MASLQLSIQRPLSCPLCRRYFLKIVPSFEKQSARYLTDLVKPLKVLMKEFILERVPATLLKIDSFKDMKQRFQRRIHKNLPHSFN